MSVRVLLIDDEKDFSDLTSTMLNFHDFDVTTYNDPIDLIENVKDNEFDVLVSDLMMPNMNGFEMIQKIRSNLTFKNIPIIVLTAKTLNDEERKFILQNDIHLMMKPFQPQNLVDMIRNLADNRSE